MLNHCTERKKMKLSSKLETLLVIGVKAAGSYDPINALGTVEEQMTPQEVTTATKFDLNPDGRIASARRFWQSRTGPTNVP